MTVLTLGGLVLTAECKSSGGPLVIMASTTKDHAGLHATGVDAAPNDTDATRDFSGGTFGNGDLRATDSVNVRWSDFASD
jgi:hypothetical protein